MKPETSINYKKIVDNVLEKISRSTGRCARCSR